MKKHIFTLILPILCFLFFALTFMHTMGLNVDEGVFLLGIKDFLLQFTEKGHTVSAENYWNQLQLGTLSFPLNFSEYNGCINLYFSSFFTAFNLTSVFLFRLSYIVIALTGIIFIYKTLKIWFDKNLATLVLILLSLNPTFINSARIGHYTEEITAIMFLWSGLFCFTLYLKLKKDKFLYTGFFLFGLGVSAKLIFGAYLVSLSSVWVLFYYKDLKLQICSKKILIATLFFISALLPFILDNLTRNFAPILDFYAAMKGGGFSKSLEPISLLNTRIEHFLSLTKQDVLPCFAKTYNYGYLYSADIWLLGLSFVLSLLKKRDRKKIFALSFFYLITFTLTVLTPKKPFSSHMVILLPLPQILMAFAFLQTAKKQKILKIAVFTLISILLMRNAAVNMLLLNNIRKNEVHRDFSAVLYPTIAWLNENEVKEFYSAAQLFNSQATAAVTKKPLICRNYTDFIILRTQTDVSSWLKTELKGKKSFWLTEQKNPKTNKKVKTSLQQLGYALTLKKSITCGPDTANIYFAAKTFNPKTI